jgi:hypothetical protein
VLVGEEEGIVRLGDSRGFPYVVFLQYPYYSPDVQIDELDEMVQRGTQLGILVEQVLDGRRIFGEQDGTAVDDRILFLPTFHQRLRQLTLFLHDKQRHNLNLPVQFVPKFDARRFGNPRFPHQRNQLTILPPLIVVGPFG